MDRLRGKTILVTGATAGIGRATAEQLAAMGARVLLHGRDPRRLETARDQIRRATGRDDLALYQADFASLADVKRMAGHLLAQEQRLDVLVNNAGIFSSRPQLSVDGYELTFAVNHLAHFLLTLLLLGKLKAAAPSRIVVVSSGAHQSGDIDYENLRATRHYSGWGAYARSKLANVLFTYRLADLLQGTGVTVNCLHPGTVDTALLRAAFSFAGGLTAEQGAATPVYLAASPEVEGLTGLYYDRRRPVRSRPITYDKDAQERLWAFSLEAVQEFLGKDTPTRFSSVP